MAIKDFAEEINALLSDLISEQKGGFVANGGVTILEVNAYTMPKALKEATNDILEGIARKQVGGSNTSKAPVMVYKKFNLQKIWVDMIKKVSNNMSAQGTNYVFTGYGNLRGKDEPRYQEDLAQGLQWRQGVYIETLTDKKIQLHIVTAISQGFGASATTDISAEKKVVEEIFDQMIGDVWDEWIEYVESKTGATLEGYKPGAGTYDLGQSSDIGFRYSSSAGSVSNPRSFTRLVGAKVKRAHKNLSTTGAYALEELERTEPQITLHGATMNTIDLRRAILSDTVISARNTRLKNRTKIGGVNLPGQQRVYEVALKKNTRESTDLQKVLNKGPRGAWKGSLLKTIRRFVNQQIKAGKIKASASTSKPFTDDVADTAILAIADKFRPKNGEILKITKGLDATPTKPHDYRVRKSPKPKGRLSKRRTVKIANKGAKLALGASAIKRTQSGKRRDKELSVPKLKYLINRSLGPMIRRNMGRPALENQTGRFSNSAELIKLKQSRKGYVGEYSYQLNPYVTFENLGRRQWPQGYNPKPLISKSIRDIAQRHVEAKFTLRRI